MEPIKKQVKEMSDVLNDKDGEGKNLRQKTKAVSLQEIVMFEIKISMQSPRNPSKIEALKKSLEAELLTQSSKQAVVEDRTRLCQNTLQLLRCKLKVRGEPAARQERMHITQHLQM